MCVCACMRKFKCLATRVFGLHTNRKGTNSSSSSSTSNRRSIPPPAPTPRTLTPHPPPSSSSYTRSISPDSSNLSALAAVCGCGRSLEPGWDCLACRSACPNCGRALAVNEECGRCAAKQSSLKHQERLETQYWYLAYTSRYLFNYPISSPPLLIYMSTLIAPVQTFT